MVPFDDERRDPPKEKLMRLSDELSLAVSVQAELIAAAKSKLREFESVIAAQAREIEALRAENSALKTKAESAAVSTEDTIYGPDEP
jgi:cell division protein FtsB